MIAGFRVKRVLPLDKRRLAALAGLLGLLALPLAGQETGTYTLRIRSNLVVLDVVPVDGDGKFVESLEISDFEVKDNGDQQQVEFFELVEAGHPLASVEGELSQVVAAPETMFFASPANTLSVVFAIDLGSISHSDLVLVRKAISEFVNRNDSPGIRFMVVTTGLGLQIRAPFTRDGRQLIAALDRIRVPNADTMRFSFAEFQADMEQLFVAHIASQNFDALLQAARMATVKGISMTNELGSQLQRTSDSLGLLANYLRALPGRKHVVFYSGGYPMEAADTLRVMIRDRVNSEVSFNPTADQRAQLEVAMEGLQNQRLFARLRRPLDQLNRSQVSIYAVDTRGLLTLADDPRRSAQQSNLQTALLGVRARYNQLDVNAPQDYLVSMASGSGGLAFLNNNDMQRGIRQAVRDGSRYYVLAYRPSKRAKPGRFRKIEVKSKRKDISVRHREGYVESADGDVIRGEIFTALTYPELFNNFNFEVDVAPHGGSLDIRTRIPTGILSFTGDHDHYSCPVETYAVLVDREGRWVDDNLLFAKSHQLQLEGADRLDQFRRTDFVTSESTVAVEPGDYRLIVVVRHGWNARLGASISKVTVAP